MPDKLVPELKHVQTEDLRLALIEAQFQLREQQQQKNGRGVLVLVSGIEMAGKGEALTQLREWVDPRYLSVRAGLNMPIKNNQPFWQPYAGYIPAKGQLVVLFGNWYGDLLEAAMQQNPFALSEQAFDDYVMQMQQFERYLKDNGVDVLKCWFDIGWNCLQQRLDGLDPSAQSWQQLHGLDWRSQKQYAQIQQWRRRFTADWYEIDGEDNDQRDLKFAHLVLDTLKAPPPLETPALPHWPDMEIPAQLISPATDSIEKEGYKVSLKKLQKQIAKLVRQQCKQSSVVVVFEGMDAAGKGGAIRRIVRPFDPREYEIHSIAAPESYERRRPYLWRFWTKMPKAGGISIFDRSWYGRVLVERLEGFAEPVEWQRAYHEINQFETQLTSRGIVLVKLWLAISKDEQLQRFEARKETPHKRFKLTEDDWRNREKWDNYLQAAADMLAYTSTPAAPWHVVATNDKKAARLQILEAVKAQLQAYPG